MDGWINEWMDGSIKRSMNRWIDGLSTATPPPSPLTDSLPTKNTGNRITNLRLRVHLHEFVVPIDTARLAPPSITDEFFDSEEDEDTSGTADTDPKQRHAALTISFRGSKVLLSVNPVVAGRVKEDGGGVAVDSPSIH